MLELVKFNPERFTLLVRHYLTSCAGARQLTSHLYSEDPDDLYHPQPVASHGGTAAPPAQARENRQSADGVIRLHFRRPPRTGAREPAVLRSVLKVQVVLRNIFIGASTRFGAGSLWGN